MMLDAVLAALYLRGLSGRAPAPRSGWRRVLGELRAHAPGLGQASSLLERRGLRHEASLLADPGLLDAAVAAVEQGRVLTAADPLYPHRWLDRLGASAPPTLWRMGEMPACPLVAVVGSRRASPAALAFARGLGGAAMQAGCGVVSGGAAGCDRAAVAGAHQAGGSGRLVEILPHGLAGVSAPPGVALLSVCEPHAPFSTAHAMERNALIYAASLGAVVCEAQWGRGGSWHGSREAMRRRDVPLAVRRDPSSPALVALERLGAQGLCLPGDLADWLAQAHVPAQGSLFVREMPAAYGLS